MSINLKQFVDINIVQHEPTSIDGSRDTVALLTEYGSQPTTRLISSWNDAQQYYSDTTTLAYLDMYFKNGGVKVLVVEGISIVNRGENNDEHLAKLNAVISNLDNSIICVTFAIAENDMASFDATCASLAKAREADSTIYGINEKILICRSTVTSGKLYGSAIKNVAAKYSSVLGAEMTIAAYLSKIDVYGIDSIHDYAFTKENIAATIIASVDDENNIFNAVINNNGNIDVYLAGAVRNCGGNMLDGLDLVNSYVRIVLHQTLTEALLSLLVQKLKSTTGISKIYAVISQELEKYKTSGYLTTDKIWTDEDLKISYNGKVYTVVEQGTPLSNGYVIKVLPMSSLTETDKAQHKAPPIYIVLADQYGIRKITVNGEVI